ncbi:MAG: DnaD domain protein [Clostridia bacterium]|nr:DnaD domain protein [Clostridia bacterium]
MSFVKFSNDFLMETFTLVDNFFITQYLPFCDEKQIKVYLYGLFLCTNPSKENSMESLLTALDVKEEEVNEIYQYFEDMGMVQIISKNPLEVKYLSLKRSMQTPKKYKSEKWNDFNIHLQQLFPERMLTPNEYNEYYMFIDDTKIDTDAMLMIVQYCINLKGMSVRYPYILTVARNWVQDGVRTMDDVEAKLEEYDAQKDQITKVLAALGRKGSADIEEKQMFTKWTKTYGYDLGAILTAVKGLKSNKSFKKLDSKLDEFYKLSIFSAEEMDDYQARRDHLIELAISINKSLGIYYQSTDHEIETYIVPWTTKGFSDDALLLIAHQCFITNIRTLDGMGNVVSKFYSKGLLTSESINEYTRIQLERDERIKKIIEATGRSRTVTQTDRDYYSTWTGIWGFDEDIILYAASQSVSRTYPVQYINQLLSQYKSAGITTYEQAVKFRPYDASKIKRDYEEREYTKEELQSIITNLDSLSEADL